MISSFIINVVCVLFDYLRMICWTSYCKGVLVGYNLVCEVNGWQMCMCVMESVAGECMVSWKCLRIVLKDHIIESDLILCQGLLIWMRRVDNILHG